MARRRSASPRCPRIPGRPTGKTSTPRLTARRRPISRVGCSRPWPVRCPTPGCARPRRVRLAAELPPLYASHGGGGRRCPGLAIEQQFPGGRPRRARPRALGRRRFGIPRPGDHGYGALGHPGRRADHRTSVGRAPRRTWPARNRAAGSVRSSSPRCDDRRLGFLVRERMDDHVIERDGELSAIAQHDVVVRPGER